jgi:hypothetical protein
MRPEFKNTGKETEMPHTRTPLTYRIECLCAQGYDSEFQITDEGLKYLKTGDVFQPGDIKIIEHQRFEGMSDPDDMAILYVIQTKSGLKGTVVDAFGTYGDGNLMAFMNQVEDKTVDNITKATIKECCD